MQATIHGEYSPVKCGLLCADGGDCFMISGETGFEPGMDSIWIYLIHCILLRKTELDVFFFFFKSSLSLRVHAMSVWLCPGKGFLSGDLTDE